MGSADFALGYLRSFEAHRDTRWFAVPCANPIDIANTETEPWYHYVFEHLKQSAGATGHQSRGSDYDMPDLKAIRVMSVTGTPLTTKLSLVRLNDGLFVFVSGEADVLEEEITTWAEAIAAAVQKLGQAHPEHEWWAVLGPDPRTHGMMSPFLGAVGLDRLAFRTADFGYRETVPVSVRGLFEIHQWIPLIVEGRSVGYDWYSASHGAHRDLYTLAALLSLESGEYWTLRERPTPTHLATPVLPESSGSLQRLTGEEEAERRTQAAEIDVDRLSYAWQELRREPRLLRPLSSYYQGISLRDDHPSFAVVAFVTAIEEIGALLIPGEPPELCATCGRQKFNASRQLFRKALELIRPVERAKELTDNLYGWRSGTAHSGQLFGYEMAFGDQPLHMGRLPLTVADTFSSAVRIRAQDAAGDLLHLALGGSRPLQPVPKRRT
jgi:hypothetical protein